VPLLPNADPLLILATVLVCGVAFGTLAKRIGLPSITGQVVAGVLIGSAGLKLFDHEGIAELHPLTAFALSLMAVTIGAHLNVRRLRNAGKRLIFLLLLGTLAISTAPATIVAVVKETRSKGVFVKTLIAAVAFNNMACILFFELARSAVHVQMGAATYSTQEILLEPTVQLLRAALIGGIGAAAMAAVMKLFNGPEKIATAAVVILLLTSGLATYLDVSPVLACLLLGVVQANFTRRDKILDAVFSDFEPAILAVFFTLAGMELSFEHIVEVGLVATIMLLMRSAGKLLSANWAMRIAGATRRVRENLGMALIPQAGVAVGLIILLQEDPMFEEQGKELLALITAVVLTVVTVNELIGPVMTRMALDRSGESGNDRMRLIDFIHEENILTDLKATSMEEAISKLTSLLITSHHLSGVDRDDLLKSVLDREAQVSTCLGGGLAVPHGTLPIGKRMLGVMGICRDGLHFETPDGRPVQCLVLLVTPEGERDRHLQVLATLARTVGSDEKLQAQLFDAKSPAHAYEILHDEEAETFNYFLED
jgi:mannitol/fructose-specific phosphotransferase system IIA component (Ntr-type)/Kef-type K+ transport system membrane component KefB